MIESNYAYLKQIHPVNYANRYVKIRVGYFKRQVEQLQLKAQESQGKTKSMLLSKLSYYESLLERIESYK